MIQEPMRSILFTLGMLKTVSLNQDDWPSIDDRETSESSQKTETESPQMTDAL